MFSLDFINTVAFGGLVLFTGYAIRRLLPWLARPLGMHPLFAVLNRPVTPRAFLVVPMVGAFFIDFVNAVVITVCLNIWS